MGIEKRRNNEQDDRNETIRYIVCERRANSLVKLVSIFLNLAYQSKLKIC